MRPETAEGGAQQAQHLHRILPTIANVPVTLPSWVIATAVRITATSLTASRRSWLDAQPELELSLNWVVGPGIRVAGTASSVAVKLALPEEPNVALQQPCAKLHAVDEGWRERPLSLLR
jgi:hypothetical protein